jgi:hypothetical protein
MQASSNICINHIFVPISPLFINYPKIFTQGYGCGTLECCIFMDTSTKYIILLDKINILLVSVRVPLIKLEVM